MTDFPIGLRGLAQARARAEGMVFVAPYDDPYTIAGQGTIGNELLRQLNTPDLDALHAIFVAIGGGGLIAGVAAYVKALRPDIKIIGVEPTGNFIGIYWKSILECSL